MNSSSRFAPFSRIDWRNELFYLGIACSTANLLFLSVWSELLFTKRASAYYMLSPPAAPDYLAAVVNTFLLSFFFYGIVRFIQRTRIDWLKYVAKLAFVASLLIPLNVVRTWFPHYFGLDVLSATVRQGRFLIPVTALVLFLLGLIIYFRRHVFIALMFLVLFFVPFAAITNGQAILKAVAASKHASFHGRSIKPIERDSTGAAVIWIIFDELDESMTFSRRPAQLSLPFFDEFKQNSVWVKYALAPSKGTLISIPSLLTGKHILNAVPSSPSELMVTIETKQSPVAFSTLPTVFSRAKRAGYRTSLVGWCHPYCRLLPGSLDYCFWRPLFQTVTGQVDANEKSLFRSMKDQAYTISPLNSRRLAVHAYSEILNSAKQVAGDATGLVFLHFPVPHLPAIYDRREQRLTTTVISNIQGFVDNVALADRTLAEIRRVMEQNKLWERSCVIVTSDHPWRGRRIYDGQYYPYVPFLVKMPGQQHEITIEKEFQTVQTGELALAILKGDIKDSAGVAAWISTHSSDANP